MPTAVTYSTTKVGSPSHWSWWKALYWWKSKLTQKSFL